ADQAPAIAPSGSNVAQEAPEHAAIHSATSVVIAEAHRLQKVSNMTLIVDRQGFHGATPGISRATPRSASESSFRYAIVDCMERCPTTSPITLSGVSRPSRLTARACRKA